VILGPTLAHELSGSAHFEFTIILDTEKIVLEIVPE
jgi:hypothetical protein